MAVTDPAFRARVRALVEEARASGAARQISSYLDPDGDVLVSEARSAWQKGTSVNRIMLLRDMGRLAFATLRDSSGAIQLMATAKVTEHYKGLTGLNLGDCFAYAHARLHGEARAPVGFVSTSSESSRFLASLSSAGSSSPRATAAS